MAPSDPEVIVDQVGNLSSREGNGLIFLGLFVPPDWFSFWNWELWMILFRAEAILASSTSKFGIEIPRVDDEDLNSSTESTNSTLFDPLHRLRRKFWTSTYLSLESYLPASKRGWFRELVKVEIRNLQSLLVCPQNSLKSLLHWRWLNLWLTVQTGISDLDFVLVFHSSPL